MKMDVIFESHGLYVYNTWSQNGMSIIGRNYVIICASEVTVENIISSYRPDTIEKFFEVLRNMNIKYEEIVPKSLEI
jgi:hypothetical protein